MTEKERKVLALQDEAKARAIMFEADFRQALLEVAEAAGLPLDLYGLFEATARELAKQVLEAGHERELRDVRAHARRCYNGFRMVIPAWAFEPAVPGVH